MVLGWVRHVKTSFEVEVDLLLPKTAASELDGIVRSHGEYEAIAHEPNLGGSEVR